MRRAVKAAAVLVLSRGFYNRKLFAGTCIFASAGEQTTGHGGRAGPGVCACRDYDRMGRCGGMYGQEETGQSGAGREETRPEEFSLMDFDAEEIDAFLSRASNGRDPVSFRELMELLITGNFEQAASGAAKAVSDAFFSEIRSNTALMGQIIVLALAGAVFFQLFRNFWLRPCVGNRVLRDLPVHHGAFGGHLLCQYPGGG